MKRFTYIFLISLATSFSYAQRYDYKEIKGKYYDSYTNALKNRDSIKGFFSKSINATSYLPKNYSVNGDIDYTKYLQIALNEKGNIILPDFPILISPDGLKVKSNTNIYFPKNSKLVMQPNDKHTYHAILLEDVQNVNIYYPNIVGDKNHHLSDEGQWGMGVWLNNSKNIKIFAPKVVNFWGDGIYIGSRHGYISKNIIISHGFINSNRRNGVSIIAGENILIKNTTISNTIGHNPQSGIDIEPNSNRDKLSNIQLLNISTYHNPWNGIIVSLSKLVGKEKKHVSILIDGHRDYFSKIGLAVSLSEKKKMSSNVPLEGNITIRNSQYYDNKIFLRNYTKYKSLIDVEAENIYLWRNNSQIMVSNNIIGLLNTNKENDNYIEIR